MIAEIGDCARDGIVMRSLEVKVRFFFWGGIGARLEKRAPL